jgi:hypothetical protein
MAILIGYFTGILYFIIKFSFTHKETKTIPILLVASTIVGGLAGALVGLFS